jgi:hypothetical protein
MKAIFSIVISLIFLVEIANSVPRKGSNQSDLVAASPNQGWDSLPPKISNSEPSVFFQILTWIPNRALDLIDVIKFDIGVGPALGVKATLTPNFEVGGRFFFPSSIRIGNFGRSSPLAIESEAEYGISPFFKRNNERLLCDYQLSAGLDAFVASANLTLCPSEFLDFLGGIFFLDPEGDDIANPT